MRYHLEPDDACDRHRVLIWLYSISPHWKKLFGNTYYGATNSVTKIGTRVRLGRSMSISTGATSQ